MKKIIYSLCLILLPMMAAGQTKELDYTYVDPECETGIRFDANLEMSLVPKVLKLNLQEEIRINDNFSHLQKSYTTVGLDCRIFPWLKAGADYSFVLNNSHSNGWGVRHRGAFSLTERVKFNRWEISFRERIQATRRMDSVNVYQSPRTELSLKTRVKVSYDVPGSSCEPYVSAETRFLLNGVRPGRFIYYESTGRWSNPYPEYTDVYLNRLRLNLGTRYKTSKRNEFNFYIVADLCYDLDIDFNSKGNQKKDEASPSGYADYLFVRNTCFIGLGISYTFKL